MNEVYEVKVESPLLRHGLSIVTKVSKEHIKEASDLLMEQVHKINNTKPDLQQRLELVIEAQKQELARKEASISNLEDQLHEALKVPETLSKEQQEALTISDLNSESDPNYEREEKENTHDSKE